MRGLSATCHPSPPFHDQKIRRQVLDAACAQGRRWQLQHPSDPPLSVSVNLSPRQLHHDGLVEQVTGALEASGLSASSLVLEITEGAMMHDTEATVAKLADLKALGVKLAVDDLKSYAKSVGVDASKFDKCLDSGEKKTEVNADQKAGTEAGVNGTPAFFINGIFINGAQPYEQIKQTVDRELKKKG